MSTNHVRALYDEPQKTAAELQKLAAATEGRELSPSESARWRHLEESIDGFDDQIGSNLKAAEREERSAEFKRSIPGLTGVDGVDVRNLGARDPFVDRMVGIGRGETRSLIETRDLLSETATDGAELVESVLGDRVHIGLEDFTRVAPILPTVFRSGVGASVVLPRETTAHAIAAAGEAAALAESDAQFATTTFVFEKAGSIQQASSELFEDSPLDVGGMLMRQAMRATAQFVDAQLLVGSGSSNQIEGLLTNSSYGITETAAAASTANSGNGGDVDVDDIIDAAGRILAAGGNPSHVVMHPSVYTKMVKVEDGDNRKLLGTEVRPNVDTIAGLTVVLSQKVPIDITTGTSDTTSKVLVGDFSAMSDGALRIVKREPTFEVSRDFAFNLDLITTRLTVRHAFKVLEPECFEIIDEVESA